MSIAPVHDRLLRGDDQVPLGIAQLHLVTADQLTRLHYSPGSIKYVKKHLKAMTGNGLIVSDALPTKQRSSPFYYALGAKGAEYLNRAGMEVKAYRGSKAEDDSPFVRHTLEVNDLLISAMLLGKVNPAYWLDDYRHEHDLKRKPYMLGRRPLIPDGFLNFQTRTPGGVMQMPIALEHDRGTEFQQDFRQKIRRYVTFLHKRGQAELFGVGAITIAFTTFKGDARLEQMRRWTKAELSYTSEPETIWRAFYLAALDKPPEPCQVWLEVKWYTAFDDTPVALLAM